MTLSSAFDRSDARVVSIDDRVALGHVVNHGDVAIRTSNQALQQATMFAGQSIAAVEVVLAKLCLDSFENFLIYNRLVLALVKVRLVLDLSTIDWIGQ